MELAQDIQFRNSNLARKFSRSVRDNWPHPLRVNRGMGFSWMDWFPLRPWLWRQTSLESHRVWARLMSAERTFLVEKLWLAPKILFDKSFISYTPIHPFIFSYSVNGEYKFDHFSKDSLYFPRSACFWPTEHRIRRWQPLQMPESVEELPCQTAPAAAFPSRFPRNSALARLGLQPPGKTKNVSIWSERKEVNGQIELNEKDLILLDFFRSWNCVQVNMLIETRK